MEKEARHRRPHIVWVVSLIRVVRDKPGNKTLMLNAVAKRQKQARQQMHLCLIRSSRWNDSEKSGLSVRHVLPEAGLKCEEGPSLHSRAQLVISSGQKGPCWRSLGVCGWRLLSLVQESFLYSSELCLSQGRFGTLNVTRKQK